MEIDARDSVLMPLFVVGAEGWRVREWLDPDVLARLAELGVGTVRWSVSRTKREDAQSIADRLGKASPMRVEILASRSELPPMVLTGPPPAVASARLEDVLKGLGSPDSLQSLWPEDLSVKRGLPALRPGGPASFLQIRPAPAGEIDPSAAALVSIWHDGIELEIEP
jgi:hypothetical protein